VDNLILYSFTSDAQSVCCLLLGVSTV